MKIGTLTFHWAKNYGAVLQAYALQHFLNKHGYQTEIINYLPRRVMLLQLLSAFKKRDICFLKKIKKFKTFRKNELLLSKKIYFNNKALFKCKNEYSSVICGSDQIWNMSFTKGAEGKPTLSYFLNFVGEDTKRISYAASLGTKNLDAEVTKLIKPELDKFSAISVRENSAVDMLKEIEISSITVLDPTLLLEVEDYNELIKSIDSNDKFNLCSYIIHSNQEIANQVNNYITEKLSKNSIPNINMNDCSVYEWLYRIKHSNYIITNSFHGTVFSLIFHKPFISVTIPNSGMNDRLITLLNTIGLSNRLINEFNPSEIDQILQSEINWNEVDKNLQVLKNKSKLFLAEVLKE